MKQVSNKVLFGLIAVFVIMNCANIYLFLGTPEEPTGRAAGSVSFFMYPSCTETTNATNESIVTTATNFTSINASAEVVKMYYEINTTADVAGEILYTARCNTNIQTPVGVAGKTVIKTYYIGASSGLNGSLSQIVVRPYYTDAWLAAAGLSEATLALYRWTGVAWAEIGSVDTTNNYAEGTLTDFNRFGLFAGVANVSAAPTPAPAGGGGGGGGGGAPKKVKAEEVVIAERIITPIKKAVTTTTKKIAEIAAPVTQAYWPIIAIATLLVIGMGVWVGRRKIMRK